MGMPSEQVSRVTAKGQTTIPKAVRRALGVEAGDRIVFRVDGDEVTVHRAEENIDPVVTAFLAFLAHDLERDPGAVVALGPELRARLDALTDGTRVDLEAPIEGEVEL